jgi:hypothetical protein
VPGLRLVPPLQDPAADVHSHARGEGDRQMTALLFLILFFVAVAVLAAVSDTE